VGHRGSQGPAGISALIACRCFEILIRKLAARFGISTIESPDSLDQVIQEFPNYGTVDSLRKALWDNIRTMRNKFIHYGRLPDLHQTRLIIEEVDRLELDLESEAPYRSK